MVRYAIGDSARKIFTSRYQLELPSEEELLEELRRERAQHELKQRDGNESPE